MYIVDNYAPNDIAGNIGASGADEVMRMSRFEPGLLRPYVDNKGMRCVQIQNGWKVYRDTKSGQQVKKKNYRKMTCLEAMARGYESPVLMNAATLRIDQWKELDRAVQRVKRANLGAWPDLESKSSFNIDGMSTMILEYETVDDPGEAVVDMDVLSDGRTDAPLFGLRGLPIPITHSDFFFSRRRISVSEKRGQGVDTFMAEAATRRVQETIERTLIGTETGVSYGIASEYDMAPTVYGYLNFPDRITKSDMVAPDGTNGPAVLTSWLELIQLLKDDHFAGPFTVYVSTDWDIYLDNLFSTTEPSAGSLRQRLLQIGSISTIKRLEYLDATDNPFTVIVVQHTSDVVRAVNGMDYRVVQWETRGGMQMNFKVMAIKVPQFRSDANGRSGVAVGTTS